MTVQEFVYTDKDLQTVLDISDVNIIILIYLFIKHVLFILYLLNMYYLYLCICTSAKCMSVELKVDHLTSGFQCPSVYRQTRYTAKLPTAQKVAV